MLPKCQASPITAKNTAISSRSRTKHLKAISSINNIYKQQDPLPKKSQASLNNKKFHILKPSLENLVCNSAMRKKVRNSKIFENSGSFKSIVGSFKKEHKMS